MGKLGGFGSLSFVVSSNTIRTFEKLQWDVGASYATHDRHMMPVFRLPGNEPDTGSGAVAGYDQERDGRTAGAGRPRLR